MRFCALRQESWLLSTKSIEHPHCLRFFEESSTTGGLRESVRGTFFCSGRQQSSSCVKHQNRSQAALHT